MPSLGNETRLVKHKCAHCGKQLDLYDKVASGGVVFLFGKNDGHYGIACPECKKTTLRTLNKGKLDSLRRLLLKKMGRREGLNQPRLQYNSFPYRTTHLPGISSVLTGHFIKPLGGNCGSLSQDEIEHAITDQREIPESYSSYWIGDSATGPAIAVWWLKKEGIEHLLGIENKNRLRVFPRYVLYDPLIAAIQNLCWKYDISENPISKLKLSAYPELEIEREQDKSLNIDIAKNTEFLSLLKYHNSQLDPLGQTKNKEDRHSQTDMPDLWAAISENFDSQFLQKELSLLSYRFIEEFSLMACRTGFSAQNAAKLKDKYVRYLSESYENTGRKHWAIPSRLESAEGSQIPFSEDKPLFASRCSKAAALQEKKIRRNKLRLARMNLIPHYAEPRHKDRTTLGEILLIPPALVTLAPYLWISALVEDKISKARERDARLEELRDEQESPILESQRTGHLKLSNEEEVLDNQSAISDRVMELEKHFSSLREIITRNSDLVELKYKISEVAKFNTDVLILGETGTGKELFAHAIHQMSGREGNFAPINCSAIPKDLFESELFGHKKGAFSGAFYDKKGAFEYANQGTLFLDEIGEMPLEMQAKILRAVEYRTINRLGSMNPIPLDLRIVFATNRDLKKEAEEGRFRKDLFFRIFSPSFRIIPLRERIEDIPLLVEHFLNICNEKFQKKVEAVAPSLMSMFKKYAWAGNVRELMKVIEMGVINSMGSTITHKEISYFTGDMLKEQGSTHGEDLPTATKITDEDIKYWMEKLNHNKSKVARRLGVSYRTILRRSKDIYH